MDEYLRWRKEEAAKLRQEIEGRQVSNSTLREKVEARRRLWAFARARLPRTIAGEAQDGPAC